MVAEKTNWAGLSQSRSTGTSGVNEERGANSLSAGNCAETGRAICQAT